MPFRIFMTTGPLLTREIILYLLHDGVVDLLERGGHVFVTVEERSKVDLLDRQS